MPATVSWDSFTANTLLYRFEGFWTTQEFNSTVTRGLALIASKPSVTVYSIADVSESLQLPHNIEQTLIRFANEPKKLIPTNAGTTIIAGGGLLVDIVLETFKKRHPSKSGWFLTAPSVVEARRMIVDFAAF